MDGVDALLFAILAACDLALLFYLRRRRARRVLEQKLTESLAEAMRGELGTPVRRRIGRKTQPLAPAAPVPLPPTPEPGT